MPRGGGELRQEETMSRGLEKQQVGPAALNCSSSGHERISSIDEACQLPTDRASNCKDIGGAAREAPVVQAGNGW